VFCLFSLLISQVGLNIFTCELDVCFPDSAAASLVNICADCLVGFVMFV